MDKYGYIVDISMDRNMEISYLYMDNIYEIMDISMIWIYL